MSPQQRAKAAQRRLGERGAGELTARLAAEAGMLAFTIAVERWSQTMTNRSRSMPQRP